MGYEGVKLYNSSFTTGNMQKSIPIKVNDGVFYYLYFGIGREGLEGSLLLLIIGFIYSKISFFLFLFK